MQQTTSPSPSLHLVAEGSEKQTKKNRIKKEWKENRASRSPTIWFPFPETPGTPMLCIRPCYQSLVHACSPPLFLCQAAGFVALLGSSRCVPVSNTSCASPFSARRHVVPPALAGLLSSPSDPMTLLSRPSLQIISSSTCSLGWQRRSRSTYQKHRLRSRQPSDAPSAPG